LLVNYCSNCTSVLSLLLAQFTNLWLEQMSVMISTQCSV